MSHPFYYLLEKELVNSIYNYHIDNYDDVRFGEQRIPLVFSKQWFFERFFEKRVYKNYEVGVLLNKSIAIIGKFGEKLTKVYDKLEDINSKELLVKLIAYQILGFKKIKLPSNNKLYKDAINKEKQCFNIIDYLEVNFLGDIKKLYSADLSKFGYQINLYCGGIINEFILKQYNFKDLIKAEKGDVVFDCGVCYGDTSLHFAYLVGNEGKVFGYEFIPSNLSVAYVNFEKNTHLSSNIEIIKKALWNKSNLRAYFKDLGPGSKISFDDFNQSEGFVETTTIDETVKNKKIQKVDFIKMDIEGAELKALVGAKDTLFKFKPKLAIATYHSMEDFVDILIWIDSLGLGYKFYLGHTTIHWEETILFAKVN